MEDQSNKVSSRVGGFFTPEGVLKSKKQLADEETKSSSSSETSAANIEESVSIESSSNKRDPLSEIRTSTMTQVNSALFNNSEVGADISDAQDLVSQEEKLLTEIQDKQGTASEEEMEALKTQYNEVAQKRNELAQQVNKNNQQRLSDGSTTIRVGDKSYGSFTPRQVNFQSGSEVDLSSADSINKAIEERKATQKDLASQADANKKDLSAVRDASTKAMNEIKKIEGTVSSESEASNLADSIASAVRSSGTSSVQAFNPKSIDQQVLSNLLG